MVISSFAPPGKGGGPEPARPSETPAWACGWLYLFDTDAGWQKLGFSKVPERRLAQDTRTKLPFRVELAHAFPVGTRNVETRLHGFFAPCHVRGEWFALDDEGVGLVKGVELARTTADLRLPSGVYMGGRHAVTGAVPQGRLFPCPWCRADSVFLDVGARSVWCCTACEFASSVPQREGTPCRLPSRPR